MKTTWWVTPSDTHHNTLSNKKKQPLKCSVDYNFENQNSSQEHFAIIHFLHRNNGTEGEVSTISRLLSGMCLQPIRQHYCVRQYCNKVFISAVTQWHAPKLTIHIPGWFYKHWDRLGLDSSNIQPGTWGRKHMFLIAHMEGYGFIK